MPYRINPRTGQREELGGFGPPVSQIRPADFLAPTPVEAAERPRRSVAQGIGQFLFPRIMAFGREVGALGRLGLSTRGFEREQQRRESEITRFLRQAKTEKDPQKRRALLRQARGVSEEGGRRIRGITERFEAESGTPITEEITPGQALRKVFGVAGEIGTLLMPIGKLAQGARLTQRILQTAKMGAKVGTLYGATDPNARTAEERIRKAVSGTLTGAVTAGAVSPLFELPRGLVRSFLSGSGNKARVSRLFLMSPARREQFEKSAKGLNFEEEIMARDGRAISGMTYDQMTNHFRNRLGEATRNLEGLLSASEKTVSKNALVRKLSSLARTLRPRVGNVGSSGAIANIKSVVADLKRYPTDAMPVLTANNLKRQLQKLGEAAYSTTGKPTAASAAMADAASLFQRAVEILEPEAQGMNRSIQLYRAARRAIELTGYREANKLSNDLAQKVIQIIPTAAAIGAGIGGYAAFGSAQAGLGTGIATLLLTGGAGALRNLYLGPRMKSRIASWTSGLARTLKKKGVKRADEIAGEIFLQTMAATVRQRVGAADAEEGAEEPTPAPSRVPGAPQAAPQGVPLSGIQGMPPMAGGGTILIRNRRTGEERQVSRGDLPKYGLAGDAQEALPGLPSKSEIYAAMVLDAQRTGGKNISKLNTLLGAYEKTFGSDLSAAQKKRLTQLEQAETTVNLVEEVALKAKTGLRAYAKGKLGRFPDVEGGSEEDLERLTDGLAKAIAATLASESGVATDRDIKRWKGLMPRLTDTMAERVRALERLRSALNGERERLSIPEQRAQQGPAVEDFLSGIE